MCGAPPRLRVDAVGAAPVRVADGSRVVAADPTVGRMPAGAFVPPPGFSRETTIVRDAAGRWSQDGVPLEHANLVRAFDAWVDRAEDGRLCLRNELGWAYVTIEGAPLFVRAVSIEGDHVRLRLSDGREEPLDPGTLRLGPDDALYCDARGGRLAARFDRHAQVQLGALLDEDDAGVHLRVDGLRVTPQAVADPLAPRR